MYRNPEYYPDPTAGAALRQLRRKENRLNTGKQFEADWKKSIPPDAWCYRLKDSAATYYGGNENLSFSVDNICDFEVTAIRCTITSSSRPSRHPASRWKRSLASSTGTSSGITSSSTSPTWPLRRPTRAKRPMW